MKTRFLFLVVLPVLMLISSVGIFFIEGYGDSPYTSLFDSLWWTVVTFTTVGYGDMSPATTEGRIFGMLILAIGVLLNSIIISLISDMFFNFRSGTERGLKAIEISKHVLVCSDDSEFISSILLENVSLIEDDRVVIVCPFSEHPLLTTDFKSVPWVSGHSYHMDVLKKASASQTDIAYVSFSDDSYTLMTVLQIENLTEGKAVTMAQYRGEDNRMHLENVGCDHAVDPYNIYVPLMIEAYLEQGVPGWIREVILRGNDSSTLEGKDLEKDFVGKTWLEYVLYCKETLGAMPLGFVQNEVTHVNPNADEILKEGINVMVLLPPKNMPKGEDVSHAKSLIGMEEIPLAGHIIVSSDNEDFIHKMLHEFEFFEIKDEIVVITEAKKPQELPSELNLEWIVEDSHSVNAITLARATEAKIAFIDHAHDGHTLMTVLRMEQITGGSIFTIASFREPDFNQQLLKVGCDFCFNATELTAPILSQTANHEGTGVLVEQLISEEASGSNLMVRKLNSKWENCSWLKCIEILKTRAKQLPVGLIKTQGEEAKLLTNPAVSVIVESGDQVLFIVKSEEEIVQDFYEPHYLEILEHAREERDGGSEQREQESHELFQQGLNSLKGKGGATKDPLNAYRLFHKAAILGHVKAKYNLGTMNYNGTGVPKNHEESFYWLKNAAAHGHQGAQKAIQSIKVLEEDAAQFEQEYKSFAPILFDELDEAQQFWCTKAVVALIMADKRIDLHERAYLHEATHALTQADQIQELEEAILFEKELDLSCDLNFSIEEQKDILQKFAAIATVDRTFEESEQTLLQHIGEQMGASEEIIEEAFRQGSANLRQFRVHYLGTREGIIPDKKS